VHVAVFAGGRQRADDDFRATHGCGAALHDERVGTVTPADRDPRGTLHLRGETARELCTRAWLWRRKDDVERRAARDAHPLREHDLARSPRNELMEAGSCFVVPCGDELAIETDVTRFADDVDRERHGRLDRRAKLTYAGRTATIEGGCRAPMPRSAGEVDGLEAREPGRVTALHLGEEPRGLRELGVGA
jgi:hypothetical protein